MNKYRWHDAAKDKPEDGRDVLVCFSGMMGVRSYYYTYSVGCYWAEDDEWDLQGFGGTPAKPFRIHGWKEIEPFGWEE